MSLKKFEKIVTNRHVLVNTDNTTVVAYINKMGGTRSPTLCYLLWEIMLWCQHREIILRARHLPGKRNHIADALSRNRVVRPTEWTLPQGVVNQVFCHWETPMMDLFATFQNRKLPIFVSPVPDPRAMAVDALSISWKEAIAYAFPPIPLIPLVLNKILRENAVVILIAPLWPNKSWFPLLLDLTVDRPLELPNRADLLSQGHDLVHPEPRLFHLHAFKLSSRPLLRKIFLDQLPRLLPDLNEQVLMPRMSTSGENSLIGVPSGRLIHSVPMPLK